MFAKQLDATERVGEQGLGGERRFRRDKSEFFHKGRGELTLCLLGTAGKCNQSILRFRGYPAEHIVIDAPQAHLGDVGREKATLVVKFGCNHGGSVRSGC